MLVVDWGDRYRIVGQNEHATAAGRFADHWGNEDFARPEPRSIVRAAAHTHDNGWATWDLHPHLDEDGTPVNLFEVDEADWEQFFERGIEGVVEMDPYAGLLVSMHGSGVRRRRYGTVPSMPDKRATYADFVASEEARQRALESELQNSDTYGNHLDREVTRMLKTLHETGEYAGSNPVWRNYRLLQVWDRLALHLCRTPRLEPGTLEPVPVAPAEPDVRLTITPRNETTARLDPYPFDVDPLVVPIRERTIPNRRFQDRTDIVTAFYDAEQLTVKFTLHS